MATVTRLVTGYYGRYRAIAENKTYSLLLGCAFFSLTGDLVATVATIWTLNTRTSAPALFVTAAVIGTRAAFALASPVMGSLVDRFGSWPPLLLSTVLRTVLMGGLGFVLSQPQRGLAPWLGVALVSADYALAPLARTGEFTLIQILVPEAHLVAANAAQGIQFDLAYVVGPLLGGLLAATAGIQLAILLNIVSFLAYLAMLLHLRRVNGVISGGRPAPATPQPRRGTSPGLVESLAAGFQFVFRTAPLPWLLALGFAWNLLIFGPIEVLYPILAQTFRTSASGYGLLMAANSAGFILGLAVAGGIAWRRPLAQLFALALFADGLLFVGVGLAPSLSVAAAVVLLGGVVTAPTDIFSKLIRQRIVPRSLQGRVSTAASSASFIGAPIGALAAGCAIGSIGQLAAGLMLAICGGLLAMTAGLIALRRDVRLI